LGRVRLRSGTGDAGLEHPSETIRCFCGGCCDFAARETDLAG
jgi:hypothetical protein